MSAISGDKARSDRQRKEKIQRRVRMRALRKTLEEKAPQGTLAQAKKQKEFVASLDLGDRQE